jgi:hypothetical protein
LLHFLFWNWCRWIFVCCCCCCWIVIPIAWLYQLHACISTSSIFCWFGWFHKATFRDWRNTKGMAHGIFPAK